MQKNTTSPHTEAKRKSFAGKLKAWSRKLLVLSISIFVGLLIGEGIVRLVFKKKMVLFPRYQTDATYGDFKIRRIRPNMSFSHTSYDGTFHFKTNNKGFRSDTDINYEKGEGEIRVLSLGDSHTQGYEVNQNETFSYVAEDILDKKGIKSTVINTGVSGFSTAEELVLMENEGYKYKPDYVVLGFYANDFEDNLRTNLFGLKNDSLIIKNHEYIPGVNIQNKIYKYWIFRFLGEHSYLYGYAFNTVWEFYKKRKTTAATNTETEFAVATNKNISVYAGELMKTLIAHMYNFCKSRGIKLIIVDIPDANMRLSIPPDILASIKNNCDTLFGSTDITNDYKKLKLTHVLHGHMHISAETHNMLGHKIAEYILSDYKD